ncbi:MAG: DUF177 domain-containing protein [Chloroflexi bacterium]|nr:DUF177 domain-containing protein [Chloroflexota bacterium]MBI3338805.1 DUF177 domain-containing protein [Chloroflexota bacterium]
MVNSRKPFRINVGFIIHADIGHVGEFPFEFDKIKLDDLELRQFSGSAQVGRTPQGLILTGSFQGDTDLECVRCLKPYSHHLVWKLTELYAFSYKSVSESDLIIPEDAQIDLAPLLREYALLEVPINPICKPDCKGLCLECGQDLNLANCGHRQPEDDSPFSILKKLL